MDSIKDMKIVADETFRSENNLSEEIIDIAKRKEKKERINFL
jgi:hypothetical protein